MVCSKCGTNNPNNYQFCQNCGYPLVIVNNSYPNMYQGYNNFYQGQGNFVQYQKPKTNNTAIYITIIIVLAIVMFLVIPFVKGFMSVFNNPVAGYWECKNYDFVNENNGEYSFTLNLGYDDTFKWSEYTNPNTNYVEGEYHYNEDSDEENAYNKYYIVLTGTTVVFDGKIQDREYSTRYKVTLSDTEDGTDAILTNESTSNKYYCHREY